MKHFKKVNFDYFRLLNQIVFLVLVLYIHFTLFLFVFLPLPLFFFSLHRSVYQLHIQALFKSASCVLVSCIIKISPSRALFTDRFAFFSKQVCFWQKPHQVQERNVQKQKQSYRNHLQFLLFRQDAFGKNVEVLVILFIGNLV